MYFIKVKGRGYYNGTTMERHYGAYNADPYIETSEYAPVFKRSSSDVKSSFVFKTVEDADKYLQELKDNENFDSTVFDKETTEERHRWDKSKPIVYYQRIIRSDGRKVAKTFEKMEVVECTDYMVTKKSYLGHNKLTSRIDKPSKDNVICCNICRTYLIKGEPYTIIPSIKRMNPVSICFNCLDELYKRMETDYHAHPDSAAITEAWMTERVISEL